MKNIIDEVFASLISLTEEDFKKMLDEHELGEIGLALKEIWEFGSSFQLSSQIGADYYFAKNHENLMAIVETLARNNVDLYESLKAYEAANDHRYSLAA